jgi:hypothetical protein
VQYFPRQPAFALLLLKIIRTKEQPKTRLLFFAPPHPFSGKNALRPPQAPKQYKTPASERSFHKTPGDEGRAFATNNAPTIPPNRGAL